MNKILLKFLKNPLKFRINFHAMTAETLEDSQNISGIHETFFIGMFLYYHK